MEASVIVFPVMALFSFGPFAVNFAENYPVLSLFEWLPSSQLIELAKVIESSYKLGEIIIPLIVIIIWIIITSILNVWVFQKQKTD